MHLLEPRIVALTPVPFLSVTWLLLQKIPSFLLLFSLHLLYVSLSRTHAQIFQPAAPLQQLHGPSLHLEGVSQRLSYLFCPGSLPLQFPSLRASVKRNLGMEQIFYQDLTQLRSSRQDLAQLHSSRQASSLQWMQD